MLSTKSWFTAVLLGVALLILSSSPVSAALRSRTSPIRPKPHGTVHNTRATAGPRSHGRLNARNRKASRKASSTSHPRGQQSIDSVRTLEIQQALIRAHYLTGEPTGEWDTATRSALVRLQDDNHWQTKVVPDSRALIKLGLGPSQQNLLNPESAAIAVATPGPEPSAEAGTN